MASCYQAPGQTVLQHCEAVLHRFKDLIGERRLSWLLPGWFDLNLLLPLCPPIEVMELYQLWHDIGKPYCRAVDTTGHQHFPDHARVSAAIWRVHGGDPLVARLIEHDMDLHTLKPSGVSEYPHFDLAPALLLTALAELHANAELFGGFESTSFRIKWKQLNKVGNRLILQLKERKELEK